MDNNYTRETTLYYHFLDGYINTGPGTTYEIMKKSIKYITVNNDIRFVYGFDDDDYINDDDDDIEYAMKEDKTTYLLPSQIDLHTTINMFYKKDNEYLFMKINSGEGLNFHRQKDPLFCPYIGYKYDKNTNMIRIIKIFDNIYKNIKKYDK